MPGLKNGCGYRRMKKPTKTAQEPPHGHMHGFYAVIYDRNLHRKIIIPISRTEVLRGKIRLP